VDKIKSCLCIRGKPCSDLYTPRKHIVTTLVVFIFHLFYFGKFVFTFSICISFIFIFVLKFMCLVCRLGGTGARSWSFGPQAHISNKSSDTMCSDLK